MNALWLYVCQSSHYINIGMGQNTFTRIICTIISLQQECFCHMIALSLVDATLKKQCNVNALPGMQGLFRPAVVYTCQWSKSFFFYFSLWRLTNWRNKPVAKISVLRIYIKNLRFKASEFFPPLTKRKDLYNISRLELIYSWNNWREKDIASLT